MDTVGDDRSPKNLRAFVPFTRLSTWIERMWKNLRRTSGRTIENPDTLRYYDRNHETLCINLRLSKHQKTSQRGPQACLVEIAWKYPYDIRTISKPNTIACFVARKHWETDWFCASDESRGKKIRVEKISSLQIWTSQTLLAAMFLRAEWSASTLPVEPSCPWEAPCEWQDPVCGLPLRCRVHPMQWMLTPLPRRPLETTQKNPWNTGSTTLQPIYIRAV